MKSIHNILPAVIVLVVLIAAALASGLLGWTGQGEPSPQAVPMADEGPNAGLSNQGLVSKALDTMSTLRSYQFDFEGAEPTGALTPANHVSMTGYELLPGRGVKARLQSDSERTEQEIGASSLLGTFEGLLNDPMTHERRTIDFILLGEDMYLSADAGNTWRKLSPQDMVAAVRALLCSWDDSSSVAPCANLIKPLAYQDAQPSTELIDGVPTRHMATDLLAASRNWPKDAPPPGGPILFTRPPVTMSLELWTSTDATPTIRQMRVQVVTDVQDTSGQSTRVPYSLTWTWSRFNEEFGEIASPMAMKPTPTPIASAPTPLPTTLAVAPAMPRTGRVDGADDGNVLTPVPVLIMALGLALGGLLVRRRALKG